MNRIEAIREIQKAHPNAVFVLSNGLTSREANHFVDRDSHFYLLHGMGEALSVGIGLHSVMNGNEVVVIDGDGNALMGMSSWSLLPRDGLHYYVLKNGIYETTGGQPLPRFPSCDYVNTIDIVPHKQATPNPSPPIEIQERFVSKIKRLLHEGDVNQ